MTDIHNKDNTTLAHRFEKIEADIQTMIDQKTPASGPHYRILSERAEALLLDLKNSSPETARSLKPNLARIIQKLGTLETTLKSKS